MSGSAQSRWWVRIHVSSLDDIPSLRKDFQAEILRSSLRRIDGRNLLIDGIVPDSTLKPLQAARRVQVLGDLEQMTREAARHVSRVNRYRKP
ncbi:MAG: hypothetical protein ABSH05_01865 [Bryobacteraceae bacterium]|jgi:hypothetical protein